MAERWWGVHRHRVVGPVTEPEVEPVQGVTRRAAFRLFLRFLGDTLRTAPRT